METIARTPRQVADEKIAVAAVIVAIVLAVTVAVAVGVWWLQPVGGDFDAAVWKHALASTEQGNPRQRMADRLVERNVLIGKTRAEVLAMLGEPDGGNVNIPQELGYFLGAERGLISMDGEVLTIQFGPAGRVVRCYIRRT